MNKSHTNLIDLCIKMNSRISSNFKVDSTKTVDETINEFVQKFPNENLRNPKLCFLNAIINPCCSFLMYGIEDRATLYIVSPEEKEIIIFVKINPKLIIPLTKPKDHVESIKKNLIDNHGISVENLYLIAKNIIQIQHRHFARYKHCHFIFSELRSRKIMEICEKMYQNLEILF